MKKLSDLEYVHLRAHLPLQVDPLAYQCYKSFVCFATSFLVLTYNHFQFTWWGSVGAAIWVANGVMAIIAIQKAGLGICQAIWSALSIFVSFIWAAAVFHEPIKSLSLALVGEILHPSTFVSVMKILRCSGAAEKPWRAIRGQTPC